LQKLMTYQDKAELDKRTALLVNYKTTTWQETAEHVLKLVGSL
jgi:hypothetical protein